MRSGVRRLRPICIPASTGDTLLHVRLLTCAGVALATVVLAACGTSDESSWNGPPDPERDGSVSVEGFEAYRESVDEQWEDKAVLLASEFVQVSERAAAQTAIDTKATGEDGRQTVTVTVTLDELLDDAVHAERWELVMEPAGDGFRLVSATRTQSCLPDRGHVAFSPASCA